MQIVYFANWDTICTKETGHTILSSFTFFYPHTHTNVTDWSLLLLPVFKSQTIHFKLNYSHQLILRHKETNELRIFHASYNNACVLDHPTKVTRHLDSFLGELTEANHRVYQGDHLFSISLTGMSYWVYNRRRPSPHLINNRYIFTLQKDAHNNNKILE